MSADAEVIVVGLGAMGSQALWRLAARGVDVVGVEQFVPGHDRGGSHGESRIIRTAYAEGAAYVPLVREAWALWRELERASGTALLRRTGGLSIAPAASALITGPLESAQVHGLACELLSESELRARFPQFVVPDGHAGVYEADAGYLRPERAVEAAVAAARTHGARVLDRTAVAEIVPDADRPHVRLADGRRVTGRHIVVAAGGRLRELAPSLGPFLTVERRVMAWFRLTGGGGGTGAHGDRTMPVFVGGDDTGGRTWYGFPSLDGETVKLGLHMWPDIAERVRPELGNRPPDEADARRFASAVPHILAGVDPTPVRMRSCMYDLSPDEHFLIGRRRELPGLTVLGGFSGHGFKFAPIVGDIAADFALTGTTSRNVELFDPHRF